MFHSKKRRSYNQPQDNHSLLGFKDNNNKNNKNNAQSDQKEGII